jgi:hypothetical protein
LGGGFAEHKDGFRFQLIKVAELVVGHDEMGKVPAALAAHRGVCSTFFPRQEKY